MRMAILVLACTLFFNAVVYGQLPTRVSIAGEVTVATSDSLAFTFVSVAGRAWRDNIASAEKEFAFCIAHAKTLASRLNYKGKGRVVYRVAADKPSTGTAAGPEQILPALAVFHPNGPVGEAWLFLAEGQAYPHPPNERSVGAITTVASADVIRQDYVDRHGRRRETDASSCFATKPRYYWQGRINNELRGMTPPVPWRRRRSACHPGSPGHCASCARTRSVTTVRVLACRYWTGRRDRDRARCTSARCSETER